MKPVFKVICYIFVVYVFYTQYLLSESDVLHDKMNTAMDNILNSCLITSKIKENELERYK